MLGTEQKLLFDKLEGKLNQIQTQCEEDVVEARMLLIGLRNLVGGHINNPEGHIDSV
jgi:hypothetical protein